MSESTSAHDTHGTSVFDLPSPSRRGFDTADLRSTPRVRETFEVRMALDGPACHGLDLSFGGMRCTCVEPVWPGNVLDMELLLPGEARPLTVRGRVVDLISVDQQIDMRVQFEAVAPAVRALMARWLATRWCRPRGDRGSP